MPFDVAGILFAETRDYKNLLPQAATGQQADELAALRRTLAAMIAKSGDGVGYAPPAQPTVADLGTPEVFAAWQDCVAAAAAPTPLTDPAPNIAFFWKENPQQDSACVLRYPWLRQASPATAIGRAGDGSGTVTLWTMHSGSGSVSGRFPTDRPRAEYSLAGQNIGLVKGGLLFVVCLLLLLVPAYSVWNAAKASMTSVQLDALQKLNFANAAYADLLAKQSSGSRTEATGQPPSDTALTTAFGAFADAQHDAFCKTLPTEDCLAVVSGRSDNIAVHWLISLAGIVALLALISLGIRSEVGGFLVDERGRMSLSRFQFVAWTVVILSAYWIAAAWDIGIATKVHGAVLPVMTWDLWILIGIVTVSPLASSLILGPKTKITVDPDAATPPPAAGVPADETAQIGVLDARQTSYGWSFIDLFIGEETSNRSTVDISRVQQFVFTLVTLLAFFSLTLQLFVHLAPGVRIVQLPPLDTTIVGLLAISHAAYLAAKTVPKPAPNSTVKT